MATQTCCAGEAPVVHHNASFEADDSVSAKVALDNNELRGSGLPRIVGNSAALRRVLGMVRIVAPTDATVLINGETGTGKELIAEAIHKCSDRSNGPFVKVNCAAIPAGLLESELFGHERGAYTGAVARSIGRFERANRGTLFLDEIGDLPLELQPKLLRVMQERQFERLGGAATIHTDVRVICATHQNLVEMVDERQFRADLFYRLSVFPIELPPLRERPEDIRLLVHHFAMDYARRMRKPITAISEQFIDGVCVSFLAGQRPGVAKLHRAFGNSLQRSSAQWFAVGCHRRAEGIRACHAGRRGAFAHPADSPANAGCGRWSEWCGRPPGPAPHDVDLHDAAAAYQSLEKITVAGAGNSVGPKFRRPNSPDTLGCVQSLARARLQETPIRTLTGKSVRDGRSLKRHILAPRRP